MADVDEIETPGLDEAVRHERVEITDEDVSNPSCFKLRSKINSFVKQNKKIRRKTDKTILLILIWVYFLQVFP